MQLHTPMFSLGAATLGIAAVMGLWLDPCAAGTRPAERPPSNLAELRARGPAGLDELLGRYDRVAASNPARPAWEAAIDSVAAQRYAATSRLYWFTELDRAEAEAHRSGRPILALRMLGDLRNDLSCANSRLFRATLYANAELAAFLRNNFVLYWSSERPVPVVTIDFGDGRKLVRTTTGNSAHYVLDEAGHVLDVLPGLYAPQVFRAELSKSLELAGKIRGLGDAARIDATVAYHAAADRSASRNWQRLQGIRYIAGSPFLTGLSSLGRAQRAAMSKMAIEVPDLQTIGALRPNEVPDDSAAWSAIGQKLWHITDHVADGDTVGPVPGSMVLDAASRALAVRLHNAGPADQRATDREIDSVLARLEQHIVADTAHNELVLRQAIHRHIREQRVTDFATLNAWVYETLFSTPRADAWLGLLTRTDFTGLPGDGVVLP